MTKSLKYAWPMYWTILLIFSFSVECSIYLHSKEPFIQILCSRIVVFEKWNLECFKYGKANSWDNREHIIVTRTICLKWMNFWSQYVSFFHIRDLRTTRSTKNIALQCIYTFSLFTCFQLCCFCYLKKKRILNSSKETASWNPFIKCKDKVNAQLWATFIQFHGLGIVHSCQNIIRKSYQLFVSHSTNWLTQNPVWNGLCYIYLYIYKI